MKTDDEQYIALVAIISAAFYHYRQTVLTGDICAPDAKQAIGAYKTDAILRLFVDALISSLIEWQETFCQSKTQTKWV